MTARLFWNQRHCEREGVLAVVVHKAEDGERESEAREVRGRSEKRHCKSSRVLLGARI